MPICKQGVRAVFVGCAGEGAGHGTRTDSTGGEVGDDNSFGGS